jgi:hypothetical protein
VKAATTTPAAPECSIATRVDYAYRSQQTGAFVAWPKPPLAPPTDDQIAKTTTTRGATVPFVVRVETGTANRGIYYSMMLHDPRNDAPPDSLHRSTSWNGRLVYLIGDSCNGGWFRQGRTGNGIAANGQPGPPLLFFLGLGYAVASSTLNDTSTNCNPIISAETLMATKERFIELYGPPDHTIGYGVSGGASTQHSIADNYPGLLDGIVPGESFPEHPFAVEFMWHDGRLLTLFFAMRAQSCGPPSLAPCWDDAQKGAVTGYDGTAALTAPNMLSNYRNLEPDQFCPPYPPLPGEQPYPLPPGTRCDIFAAFANQLGYRPGTNVVRRPIDNVGIQYGLGALRANPDPQHGEIGAEQFVDLNEHIGGLDVDGHPSPERTHGDLDAIAAAYRSGLVTNGGLGLAATPIIDYRAYTDTFPPGDVHLRYYSFSMRERLLKANGHAGNQVMWVEHAGPSRNIYSFVFSGLLRSAFVKMDEWLDAIDAISAGGSNDPPWKKVVAARDRIGLKEGCRTTLGQPKLVFNDFLEEEQSIDSGTCAQLYPVHSFPRGVAGENSSPRESSRFATDVIKCALKPIDWADYPVTFTDDEQRRLLAAFPEGVCDYTQPGVGQQPPAGTWQRY